MIDFAEQVRHLMIRLGELSDAYYNLAQENEALKAEIRSLKKSTPEKENRNENLRSNCHN